MCDIRHYANGAPQQTRYVPEPRGYRPKDPILTKNLSFRVHVGGVGVGLKSHNLNGFFLLINGLSAGGRPLWTPDALARVNALPHPRPTRMIRLRARSASGFDGQTARAAASSQMQSALCQRAPARLLLSLVRRNSIAISCCAVFFAPPVQRGIEGRPRLGKIALLESIEKSSRCIRILTK
jgi:hypothetical protein